jgi:5-methylcytosine-specific restriction endonuclease McrA
MPIPYGNTMQCRDCHQILPIDKFSRAGKKNGYRRPECRKCQHLRSKEINPDYGWTEGTVSAREAHKLAKNDREIYVNKKLSTQNNECVYCDTKITVNNSDLDHVIPLARGGEDIVSNYQVLCGRCNKEKHSKTHQEYVSWLSELGEITKKERAKVKKYL